MGDDVTATLEKKTTLRATVDFDKPGKQTGFIQLPIRFTMTRGASFAFRSP